MDRKDGITARLLRNGGNQALRISRGSELSGTNVRTCRLPNGSLEIESMTKTSCWRPSRISHPSRRRIECPPSTSFLLRR